MQGGRFPFQCKNYGAVRYGVREVSNPGQNFRSINREAARLVFVTHTARYFTAYLPTGVDACDQVAGFLGLRSRTA